MKVADSDGGGAGVNAVPTGVKVADSDGGGRASRTWLGVKAAGHRVFVNSVAGRRPSPTGRCAAHRYRCRYRCRWSVRRWTVRRAHAGRLS